MAGPGEPRRHGLAEQATDYVLEHGIAGLSLRPLARALGTSDRMLIYHFGTKDALVAEVIERSNDRAVRLLDEWPAAPAPRDSVAGMWAAWSEPLIEACLRVYVQTAALGLLGQEPYLSAALRANLAWGRAVVDYLARSGVPETSAERVGNLVESTLLGLWVDRPVHDPPTETDPVLGDLADAVERLSRRDG